MNNMIAFLASLLSGSIRMCIPIAFAALGGTLCERSGIVNMGLEGMMLMGAFSAVCGSYLSGSAYVGLLAAVVCGCMMGLILSGLTIRYKCEHVLAGLGINMFAGGFTIVMLQTVWGSRGKSTVVAGLTAWPLPVLNRIPIIKNIIGSVSPFLVLLFVCMLLVQFVLYHTVFGLRARIIGENPYVAGSAGIDVYRTQLICVLCGSVLASIGGAYLSIGDVNLFFKDMVAGRGFIALAIVILGGWKPRGVVLGALVFGAAQSLQIRLQAAEIPPQLVQMLPYVITILALFLVKNQGKAPAAEGTHYYRDGA